MTETSTVKSMHSGVARSSLPVYFISLMITSLKCRLPPAQCVVCCGCSSDPWSNKKRGLAFHKLTYSLSVKGHMPIFSMNDPGEKEWCLPYPLMKLLAICLRKLDLLHCCNKRTVRDHTAPPPHGNHISTERDAKHIRSKGQQGAIYSVKRVLLIQVINASWGLGTTYAFSSKVTNYSAIRDHGTDLPLSTDAINKFELEIKYLSHCFGSVSI